MAHKNKNVKVSNNVKVGSSTVSGIEKGERTLDTIILTCEITIHKEVNQQLFFPGKTVDLSVRSG